MGNCVTVCKNIDPADLNLGAQIPSSTRENSAKREHSIAKLGSRPQPSLMEQETSFRDLSETEESFFDSHPRLESDCEDFFSVNGDSTFSCGNSPKTLKNCKENSPTDTKKQLIELFRENSKDDAANNYPNLKDQLEYKHKLPKSTSPSPYEFMSNSVGSSEARYLPRKEKSAPCCLPKFGVKHELP